MQHMFNLENFIGQTNLLENYKLKLNRVSFFLGSNRDKIV